MTICFSILHGFGGSGSDIFLIGHNDKERGRWISCLRLLRAHLTFSYEGQCANFTSWKRITAVDSAGLGENSWYWCNIAFFSRPSLTFAPPCYSNTVIIWKVNFCMKRLLHMQVFCVFMGVEPFGQQLATQVLPISLNLSLQSVCNSADLTTWIQLTPERLSFTETHEFVSITATVSSPNWCAET